MNEDVTAKNFIPLMRSLQKVVIPLKKGIHSFSTAWKEH
jgi:hypothetical protein